MTINNGFSQNQEKKLRGAYFNEQVAVQKQMAVKVICLTF